MSSESSTSLPPARSRRGRPRRWRMILWSSLLLPAGLIGLLLVVRQEPAFYATSDDGVAAGADAVAAEAVLRRGAGRFLSKMAALANDVARPGEWSTVIDESELNAWLAIDQPENHPDLLPAGVQDVRVRLTDGKLRVGCRLGGPLAAIAWTEVRLRLLEANRLAMIVEQCRMGLLPLPTGLASSQLANGFTRAGLGCEMLRIDGQTELVAQLPAAEIRGDADAAMSWWLDGLRIADGELVLTGSSHQVANGRRGSGL
jgi:hypothetical protein